MTNTETFPLISRRGGMQNNKSHFIAELQIPVENFIQKTWVLLTVNVLIKVMFRMMKKGAEATGGALVSFPAVWVMLILSSFPQDASESTKVLKKFLTSSEIHNNIYIWQGHLCCTFVSSSFFSKGLLGIFFSSLKNRINSSRFLLFHSFLLLLTSSLQTPSCMAWETFFWSDFRKGILDMKSNSFFSSWRDCLT